MKNIDFLPEIYTQNRVQRRAQAWWCMAAAAFAVVVLVAASTQWMIRDGIERELAKIEPKYEEALKRQAKLRSVRQEIERAEETANLYAYLSHPWPRSQILAHAIRPLPDSLRLTEITITYEAVPTPPSVAPAASSNGPAKELPSPAQSDLAQLRAECDGRQTIVSIVGTATTLSELHAYVDQLGKSPLIEAAHVQAVETTAAGGNALEPRFHLHVAVRPGYGQDGGPAIPAVPPRTAVVGPQSSTIAAVHAGTEGGAR
jgi:hypothetical protein